MTFSIATSGAASEGADPEHTSMIEAAISATLPALGQSMSSAKIEDMQCLNCTDCRVASAQLR